MENLERMCTVAKGGFRLGHCQIINTKIIDFVTWAKLKADLRSDNTGRAVHYRDILHL